MSDDAVPSDDERATERLQVLLTERAERGAPVGGEAVLTAAKADVDAGPALAPVDPGARRRNLVRDVLTAAAAVVLVVGVTAVVAVRRDDGMTVGTPSTPPPAAADARWIEIPPYAVPRKQFLFSLGPVAIDDGVAFIISQDGGSDLAGMTIYRFSTGRWETVAVPQGVPSLDVAVVWTGRELMVLSFGVDRVRRDAAYDPAQGSWRELPAGLRRPDQRDVKPFDPARALWTGSRVLSWNSSGEVVSWDPVTDVGERLSDASLASPVMDPESPSMSGPDSQFWTGDKLIVASGRPVTSAAFDPATRRWTRFDLPPGAQVGSFIWAGDRLVYLDQSGEISTLDPATGGGWTTGARLDQELYSFTGGWDGRRLVVWASLRDPGDALTSQLHGFTYDVAADRWSPIDDVPPAGYGQVIPLEGGLFVWGMVKNDGQGAVGDHPGATLSGSVRLPGAVVPALPILPRADGSPTSPERLAELRSALLGRTEDEARRIAESAGWSLLPTSIDGVDQAHILNVDPRRINVRVLQGRILGVIDIG